MNLVGGAGGLLAKVFPFPLPPSFCFTAAVASLSCHLNNCSSIPPLPATSSSSYSASLHLNPTLRTNLRNLSSPAATTINSPSTDSSPLSGLEEVMMGYLFGKKKATQVVHSLWKHVLRKGDVVIDATCGNGHDTLALLRMVADETGGGRVYSMDIQKVALESTTALLGQSLSPLEKEHVELFLMCHSKMDEVIPSGVDVRLVAFNLGYLPGGEKSIITRSNTTLLALEAAKRILAPGGLITAVVYVGHPGGREEFDTVQAFASKLPVEDWVCSKLEMLNRPLAPVVVILHRRETSEASSLVEKSGSFSRLSPPYLTGICSAAMYLQESAIGNRIYKKKKKKKSSSRRLERKLLEKCLNNSGWTSEVQFALGSLRHERR